MGPQAGTLARTPGPLYGGRWGTEAPEARVKAQRTELTHRTRTRAWGKPLLPPQEITPGGGAWAGKGGLETA